MKTRRTLLSLLLCGAIMAGGSCSSDTTDEELVEVTDPDTDDEQGEDSQEEEEERAEDDELNTNPQEVNYDNAILLTFADGQLGVVNEFETKGISIENQNGHVTINSTISGIEVHYVLSGSTSDGSVKIYSEEQFAIVLNGADITNPRGAVINSQSKQPLTLIIENETHNRLIDGETYDYYEDEDMKAALFAEGDVSITGEGILDIYGKNKHGFCSDGGLEMGSGTVYIGQAASDGIHTNDGITISGGKLTVRSESDGIESESKKEPINITGGLIDVATTGEGAHGLKTKGAININSRDKITVSVSGRTSKAVKPSGNLTIIYADMDITASGDAMWDQDDQDTSSSAGFKPGGDLLIEDGIINITCTGSGGKGMNVDGETTINGGVINITTTGDQFVYDRNNDTAAKALRSKGDLTVNGGAITVRTSKTEAEGLESKATLTINGGDIDIIAYDDCLNAADHIQINGGNIYCYSIANDGLDSNGTLTITGGLIVSSGTESPEAGIDCDQSRFEISGGIVVGLGGDTSTPTASACTQPSLVYRTSSGTSPATIRIETTNGGDDILTLAIPRSYSRSTTLLFSSAQMQASTSYTIYTGGTISGGTDFNGYFTGASYSGGSEASTFTTGSSSGSVTTVGSSSGGNPGGGGPGGGRP